MQKVKQFAFERKDLLIRAGGAAAAALILVLALALTPDTRHLLDESMLLRMKSGSILVNLARGAIVEEGALLKALDSPLAGAVLDVFETEPLPENSPLWERENLILTPHNSFVGEHNHTRMMDTVLRNLAGFLRESR